MVYAIGIDVGERSVGCAAIDFDDDGFARSVLSMVSYIHDGGEDPASGQSKVSRLAAAGVARRTRRLHLRRRERLVELEATLSQYGFVSKVDGDTYEAWHARDELSRGYVSDDTERRELLATAALHIARHRGWRNPWHSYDRVAASAFPSENLSRTLERAHAWINDPTVELATLGQAVSAVLDARGRGVTIRPRNSSAEPLMQEQVLASDQLHELRILLEVQRVAPDAIDAICRSAFRAARPHVPKTRVGHDLMPGMQQYLRATRATLEFQEFRIRAFVGNLRLKDGRELRPLAADERSEVVTALLSWRDAENPRIADVADILGVKPSAINRDALDTESVAVPIDRTSRDVERILPKKHALRAWWNEASEPQRAAWIAYIVDVTDSESLDDDSLSRPIEILSDDDEAPQLVEKLVDALQSGRTAYSRESLRRLLEHMRTTQGDEFRARTEVFGLSPDWREELPTLDEYIEHPALQRVNAIVRRFVEACQSKWGTPDRVVIEHVRDAFLGPTGLQEYRSQLRSNQTRNENRRRDLAAGGFENPSLRDVRRHLSLQRQNSTCLYCGEPIDMGNSQMDHIVPDSLGGANTRDNLVAVCRTCNAQKGKLAFVEFAKSTDRTGVSVDSAIERVRAWQRIDESTSQLRRLKQDVTRRLKMTSADVENADERSMETTAYAALEMRRRIAGTLGIDLAQVAAYRGGITREARRAGGVDAMLRVRGADDKSRFDRRHHAIDAAVITSLYPLTARTLAERSALRVAEGIEAEEQQTWREYAGRTENAAEDFVLWRQRVGSIADQIKEELDRDRIAVMRQLRLTPRSGRAHLDSIHPLAHKAIVDEWTAAEVDRITHPGAYATMLEILGTSTQLPADSDRRERFDESTAVEGNLTLFPGGGAQTLVRGGAADLGAVHHARVYAWQTKQGFGFGWIRVFAGELRPLGIANGDVLTAALPPHSSSIRTMNRALRQRIADGSARQIGWLATDDEIELNPKAEKLQSGKIGDFLSAEAERRWMLTGFYDENRASLAPALLALEGLPPEYQKVDPDSRTPAQIAVERNSQRQPSCPGNQRRVPRSDAPDHPSHCPRSTTLEVRRSPGLMESVERRQTGIPRMSQWRVADLLEFQGEIRAARGRLLVGEHEVPLAEVSCVLVGHQASLGRGVIHHVAKYGVALVTCDWRGVPLAATLGWSENTRVGARHQAQGQMSIPRRKNAWMRIVKAKIRGQASNLDSRNSMLAGRLRALALSTRSGDPDNKEAQAARTYWTRMFDHPGFTRAPGASDGSNVLLNYGYGVVRGQVIRSIVAAGLIAALGIHHSNRANAFALADDLIEPFRPAVDWVVRQLPEDAWLTDPGVKSAIVNVLDLPLNTSSQSVQTEISRLAQHFGQYVEGELEVLPVVPWDVAANG